MILIHNKRIEDAVMFHVMFALSLEPYNISLPTCESIKQDRSIEYWDHKILLKSKKSILYLENTI